MVNDRTQEKSIRVYSGAQEHSCVQWAVRDLLSDIRKTTGRDAERMDSLPEAIGADTLCIGTVGEATFDACLAALGVDGSAIAGREESFLLMPVQAGLVIAGSDRRGTMWGIYEYAQRFLGVDPLYLWTDHEPARRKDMRLPIPAQAVVDGPKTYRFRGWFINDEDLIEGFCRQGKPEAGYCFHQDYACMLDKIIETALRLKQNLLIPCSHLDILRPEDEAIVRRVTERGLYISMHHQEPVGVHQRTIDAYWAARGMTEDVNLIDHPACYREVWAQYIARWAKYEGVIWQLGLRGRGDRPVWYQNDRIPDSVQARGKLISQAIAMQLALIHAQCPGQEILSSTTLWMEGMPLYRAGALRIPAGTMVIQSDFGPNQMWGEGYDETPRDPQNPYGVYYHMAFWGCGPHLAQGNRPEKIRFNFRQALEKGDTEYVVLNVSNIREFVYGIRYEAELTWQIDRDDVADYRRRWCREQFEVTDTAALEDVYAAYFQCFASMDDSLFPAQMTFNDGMARRVAMKLMQILRGGELVADDIQNKRLYDFDGTDAFIAYYRRATQAGLKRLGQVYDQAVAAAAKIPAHRRTFFESNMLAQLSIMQGLYGLVHALCIAAENRRVGGDNAVSAAALNRAVSALDTAIAQRRQAAYGPFAHWYAGDRLINLPELRNLTAQLRGDISETK